MQMQAEIETAKETVKCESLVRLHDSQLQVESEICVPEYEGWYQHKNNWYMRKMHEMMNN